MMPPRSAPHKTYIAKLEPYAGLPFENIFIVTTARQAGIAFEELSQAGTVGFDTESKPTFRKGERSTGPHVFQFATPEKAFIFQSHVTESHEAIIGLLKATALTKIGFDLRGDLTQISDRFGVRPESLVDLDHSFKKLGYRNSIGAKTAIAILFNRRFFKSKSVTTSNWEAKILSDKQLLYAANDAFAAIQVFNALQSNPL